ncbi:MAG: hypothetical protein JO222_11030 [Frankiales bacterium]|nr:hypothetical protein [Frankiales bacterium]
MSHVSISPTASALVGLDRARELLAPSDGRPLEAVSWVSAHVTASARTTHRTARRLGLNDETARAARSARHLLSITRLFEQAHAGDALAAGVDDAALHESVVASLDEHRRDEAALLDRIAALSPDGEAAVAAAYRRMLRRAPTRPHPHSPRRGWLGAASFAAHALIDHALDTMDGRHPLSRKAPVAGPPGRWGHYLLGG